MSALRPPSVLSPTISAAARRRLTLIFVAVTLAAALSGVIGLWRTAGELGRPFGGFAWVLGYRDLYWVYPTTPHHWPAIEGGINLLDVIVSADGRSPSSLPEVFSAHAEGEVVYTIQRAGRQLQVEIPLVIFTAEMYWELYGAFVLGGISAIVTGLVLLRRTRDWPLVLMACFLLVCGAIELNQVNSPRVGSSYPPTHLSNLISSFGYPMAGMVLWRFTLVFPHPRSVLLDRPWLLTGIFALAVALGVVNALSNPPILLTRALEPIIYPAVLAFAVSGLFASLVGGALAYLAAARNHDSVASYSVRRLAVAWIVGVIVYSYIGFAIDFSAGPMPLLNEMFFSIAVIYPLLLVYALLNVQAVDKLQRNLESAEAMRDELSELRRTSPRALNQLADDLHNFVVSDIRGLQMSVRAAALYGKALDVQYVEKTLDAVYRTSRRIMEGMKPVDLQEDKLALSVECMLEGLAESAPDLAVRLEKGTWDEEFSLAVKEGLLRIIRAAVTNVRDKSGARNLNVTLSRDDEYVYATVCDDGHGFDVAEVLRPVSPGGRRHLGLRSMRAWAESLGGEMLIESDNTGTEITVTLPLVVPPEESEGLQDDASAGPSLQPAGADLQLQARG